MGGVACPGRVGAAGRGCRVGLLPVGGRARVGSALGLGACLLVAALLFQRVVVRAESDEAGGSS